MLKSMLKKECTELAAPFLLAVSCFVFAMLDQVSMARRRSNPQGEWMLDENFVYLFMLISVLLAIVMGLVQSLSEDVQGTWRYVLALPGGWRRILKLKFVCAAVVWLAWSLCVVAICLAGIAAEFGPNGEPFIRLFNPTFRILVCVPVIYLGAFLTAVRRVNWFFSRLMPLGGVCVCSFLLLYLPNWWIVGPIVIAGFAALLVGIVFHVAAARDFA